jgi:hypothetical protein
MANTLSFAATGHRVDGLFFSPVGIRAVMYALPAPVPHQVQ